ncbi:MAG: permease-like cell division protein FtsX [Firmicutes bacterium]|nr:permease-like cell division protein FtsX [Bacillota bacterium]
MFISGFRYILAETFKGLFRNRWMCVTSTGVVVVTLLMLGLFMLVNFNVGYITDTVKEQVEIVIYVDDNANSSQLADLEKRISGHPGVAEARYVSSEEHMDRLQRQLGGMLEGYDADLENPLLASYEVRTVIPENVVEIAREFEGYPGVSTVFYGQGYVENLFSVTRIIQLVGLALMIGLSITAVFLISHTIKLTVMMRKKEISIMKYVGATNWFIRWPFLLEGLLMGFAGAVMPLVALYFIYQYSVEWVVINNLMFINLLPVEQVIIELAKYLVPLGTALGILGSTFSMGRFLRV